MLRASRKLGGFVSRVEEGALLLPVPCHSAHIFISYDHAEPFVLLMSYLCKLLRLRDRFVNFGREILLCF